MIKEGYHCRIRYHNGSTIIVVSMASMWRSFVCMYVCIYIYIYIYTHTRGHTHTYSIYIYIHMYIYTRAGTHIHIKVITNYNIDKYIWFSCSLSPRSPPIMYFIDAEVKDEKKRGRGGGGGGYKPVNNFYFKSSLRIGRMS